MRIYKTSCIDNKTGMEIIASECSYNAACDYLMSKGFTKYDQFDISGDLITLTFSKPTRRTFIHDEYREILLGD